MTNEKTTRIYKIYYHDLFLYHATHGNKNIVHEKQKITMKKYELQNAMCNLLAAFPARSSDLGYRASTIVRTLRSAALMAGWMTLPVERLCNQLHLGSVFS